MVGGENVRTEGQNVWWEGENVWWEIMVRNLMITIFKIGTAHDFSTWYCIMILQIGISL